MTTPPQSTPASGEVAKTVPEADMLAVKQLLDAKVAEGAAAAEKLRTAEQALASERTARTAVEARVKELEPTKVELEGLKSRLDAANKALAETITRHLEVRRSVLHQLHGIELEATKTFTPEQLDALEKVLPTVKPVRRPGATGVDASGTGSADISGLSGREKIRAAFEADGKKP